MPKIDPIISATMQTKRIITTATQPPAAIAAAMPLTAATAAFTAAIVAYIAIFINFTEAFAATFATLSFTLKPPYFKLRKSPCFFQNTDSLMYGDSCEFDSQ